MKSAFFGGIAFIFVGIGMESAGVEGNHLYMVAGYIIGAFAMFFD